MKKLSLFILCLLSVHYVFCQQQIPINEKHYLDSLQNILKTSGADSSKANANFLLVDYWKFKDTLKSKAYLLAGKKIAKKDPYSIAVSSFYEGEYYFNWNKARASVAFRKAADALSYFTTKKAYVMRAAAWYNYAIMNIEKEGYSFITKITLEKAIPDAEKSGDSTLVAQYYTRLSTILMNNSQFAKATFYNQKAISLLESAKHDKTSLLFAYLSGVSIYCYENHAEKAKTLLNKANALLKPFPESVNYTLYFYNEVLYFSTIQAFDRALSSINKGIVLAKKYHQNQLYQQFLFRQYNIFGQQKEYRKARQILLDIIKEGTLTASMIDKATIYGEVAKTSAKLNDYKEAYKWLSKYRSVSDSINNDQIKVKVNELETKYRSVQNQHKIASLEVQNKQALLNARNNRLYNLVLGLGCLFLLASLVFVAVIARNKSKLAEQKEINYRQQLSEMEQKQQLKVTKAMLDGEEHERERVARDLHDGLGGMLAGVKIGLSGWTDTRPGASQDKDLHRIIGQLDTSVSELRRIARNMVPETLLDFGLEVALKDLCEFHMRDNLQIAFEAFNILTNIPIAIQLHIYRIAQELLSNAIKHAQASSIILQCTQDAKVFLITLEDNGIGFDHLREEKSKGMGLKSIRNRVDFFNGQMEILSAEGEGTTINIELNIDATK
ncbi:sensor histidine kinase [Pedobacter sp. GR22-10]|uniref:sensor histidine kinase n=1 Tax=Pedobacter sp. GR22-10 TaxID=2994472 RepID=UPI002246621E|nr:sensor histidine kinase [Pedobacter sp. GR22-10]MCX2431401.1 sensor histidine kinase [Pedobacter sp. GR22-10]